MQIKTCRGEIVGVDPGYPPKLPEPRGPLSEALIAALRRAPHRLGPLTFRPLAEMEPLYDEDLQLALFLCYELHYHGWEHVDDGWEWEPSLLAVRAEVESSFLAALRHATGPLAGPVEVTSALSDLVASDDGPSLAGYIQRRASIEQFREFVMHRSLYHLKEADPHTWGIPRLEGRAKAALIEIQIDEYGGGQLPKMHLELFRTTMSRLGLNTSYGAYLDAVPAITLANNNVISLFGLHRRLRGALLGHLAAFEMTSSLPNRRYGNGLRRLGADATATRFYDEHVEADAVHEQIAMHDMCGSFVDQEPWARDDVVFGAAAALALDRLMAGHLLGSWDRGHSSLRPPTAAYREAASA